MTLYEEIFVNQTTSSTMTIFEVGTWQGFGISLVFGIFGIVGLAIKGLFIYYAKFLAPQDRIINSMVKYDQVQIFCNSSSSKCGKLKNLLSPKNISSNQLFSKFFSRNVTFTKFLPKMCETKSQ